VKVTYPRLGRDELLTELRSRLPALAGNLPLCEVVLFGSWAAGRATAFSDIDLLVIYSGPPRDDAYRIVREVVGLRGLEPHVYTDDEAAALRPTLDRMTRGGVHLL
jgi:predicted nucleotidyltransferase